MEKFIILAGTTNTGKTTTINLLISDLIASGYQVAIDHKEGVGYFEDKSQECFWVNNKSGGSIILEKEGRKIVLVSYGDNTDYFDNVYGKLNYDDYYAVVCCSRTRAARKVYDYISNIIQNKIDLRKTQVVPIYKNFMSYLSDDHIENQNIVNTIMTILNN